MGNGDPACVPTLGTKALAVLGRRPEDAGVVSSQDGSGARSFLSMTFEVLHCAFVCFRLFARAERAEVPSLAGLRILLA